MMENFEYPSLLIQLNEKQKQKIDDMMHRKQLYFIYQFVYFWQGGVGTNKTFTLKYIIQDFYDYIIKHIFWLNKNQGFVTQKRVDLSQCEHRMFILVLWVTAVFGFRRSLILHGNAWSFCSWCVKEWRRIFIKIDGVGLRRTARNDD
jgi:hypothetical protein